MLASPNPQVLAIGLFLAGLAAFFLDVSWAGAQAPKPETPTAVAVYSIVTGNTFVTVSDELEVRWSSSDSTVTDFKIQWKSGEQEYESSRQDQVQTSAAIESLSSTESSKRYKHTIDELTEGTEYTVRVIATNAGGDSDPSSEVTGTPDAAVGLSALAFIENEVLDIYADAYPWLQDTLDYINDQNVPVVFQGGGSGFTSVPCSPLFYPLEAGLRKCFGTRVAIGQNNDNVIRTVVHELAHVYTLVNGVTSDPSPVAVAHMYFYSLGLPGEVFCHPRELYADIMSRAVIGHPGIHRYWASCPGTTDGIAEDALTVVRSAVAGTMPSWFSTAYDTGEGDPDLERLWADIGTVPLESDRSAIVFQLRDAFGGYCDNAKATASAFANGVTRNPWRDGGCTPKAPGSLAVTPSGAGKMTVTWSAPTDDGGSPIGGYKVQWKSGSQDFDVSRQASVNDPARLQYVIAGLSDGVAHTVQVLAWNHNGDGDSSAEARATAMATDSTAPVLLTSRVDRSTLALTWNEALDVSSQPDVSDFAVSVGGNNRAITGVSVSDNAVTLTLSSAVGVGQAVTVAYTVPTGEDASPLRDTASNNAPGFSAQMARNDTTSAAITSDPGSDMTYAVRDAYYRRDVIELGVTFGEPVTVAGSPELKFDIGSDEKKVRYVGGSGTTTLTFRYTVAEGDLAANGLSIPTGVLSGNGTVRYTADRTWAPSYVALDPQDGHKVDGIRPTIVSATGKAGETTVTLIWDKTLDENAVPPTIRPRVLYLRDMAVDADRSGDITDISVNGSEVTLTLDTALLSDDELRVSYHRATRSTAFPDASPVRDTIGNWAANSSALIVIRPANEKPTFSEGAGVARSVVEGTAADMDIGAPVAAVDPDADTLTYSLGGTDAFTIVRSTGQLRTSEALDFETKSSYSLTVEVRDGRDDMGNTSDTVDDTRTVTITVENVEESGVVTLATDTGTIQARAEVTATLEDDDGVTGSVGWQWARSPNWQTDWVNIAGATSATYTPTLEEDAGNYIRATASYNDGHGPNKTAEKVSARVGDPPPVNSEPVFPSTEDGRREVEENATGGTAVGAPVQATDLNAGDSNVNDPLVYSLTGTDAASFTIDGSTGQLRVASGAELDYEGKRTYRVTVEVTDGRDQNGDDDMDVIDARQNVTITVTNVNEAPEIMGDAAPSFEENGSNAVASYTAVDPERDTLTWSVNNEDFWISQRGQLHLRSPPSFESGITSYSVTVSASDGTLSGSLFATITVTDAEEEGMITIEPPRGWDGTTFQSVVDDDDGGITGETWQWARSSNRSRWVDISGATASSYTATSADDNQYLRLTASYEDRRGSNKTASTTLTGRIEDSADRPISNNAPTFTETAPERSVGQGTAPGRNVGAPVRATDEDTGDVLTYSLHGTDGALFDIDPATGQVLTRAVLDYDPVGTNAYSVQVSVHDGYGPDYQSTDVGVDATVTVTITVTTVAQGTSSSGGSGGGGGGGGPAAAPAAAAVL